MNQRFETLEDLMSYLRTLEERRFTGKVRVIWEGGRISWVYEHASGALDGDLMRADIR